jgi:hypothetical protein
MKHGVDTPYRGNRQRLAIDSTRRSQVLVEFIHDRRREVAHQDVTETRLEVAFDDRCEISNGGG